MIHRKTFSYVFTAGLAVTLAAVVAETASTGGWALRIPLFSGKSTPELSSATGSWTGPVAQTARGPLAIGTGADVAGRPLLAGLPPAFAMFEAASLSHPALQHSNAPLWGGSRESSAASGGKSSRGASSMGFSTPGVGGGGASGKRRSAGGNGSSSADVSAASEGAASSSGGAAASSAAGGDSGLFAEQAASIGKLTDGTDEVSVAALEGVAGGAGRALNEMSPNPEPGSLLLIGTGLLGMLGALRRRLV